MIRLARPGGIGATADRLRKARRVIDSGWSAQGVLFRLRYDGLRSSRTESASSPIPADGDGAMVTSSTVQTGR